MPGPLARAPFGVAYRLLCRRRVDRGRCLVYTVLGPGVWCNRSGALHEVVWLVNPPKHDLQKYCLPPYQTTYHLPTTYHL